MITIRRLASVAVYGVVLVMLAVPIWNLLTPHRPVDNLRSLEGCFEGEGLPDFMRRPHHWSLRITNGNMIDRDGNEISKIRLSGREMDETRLIFSPGILVAGKPSTVMAGDTLTGKAYLAGGRVTLVLSDETRQVLLKTTCR